MFRKIEGLVIVIFSIQRVSCYNWESKASKEEQKNWKINLKNHSQQKMAL